jgi:hypothetical protein
LVLYTYLQLNQGSWYFFHGKMPGCCLPSLTAATGLHFTAGYLKLSLQQEPTPCFAFLGGNNPLPIRSTVRSSCREVNDHTVTSTGWLSFFAGGGERQKHVSALNGALATGCKAPGLSGKNKTPRPLN